jgi:hypothetical protein
MPLIEDIIAQLRAFGFLPMGFEELHHWRRTTRVKSPRLAPGTLPFSRGQMIHGDILFFRDPDTISDDAETLLRAAFLALAYGYVDHAVALMKRAPAVQWLKRVHGFDLERLLGIVSRQHARFYRQQQRRQLISDLLFRLRRAAPF